MRLGHVDLELVRPEAYFFYFLGHPHCPISSDSEDKSVSYPDPGEGEKHMVRRANERARARRSTTQLSNTAEKRMRSGTQGIR